MKNLKIGTKLLGGFILVAMIVLVVGAAGWYGSWKTNASLSTAVDNCLPSITELLNMRVRNQFIRVANLKIDDPYLPEVEYNNFLATIKTSFEENDKSWAAYNLLPRDSKEDALAKEVASLIGKFKTAEEEYLIVIRAYRQWKNKNDYARIKEFQDGTFTKLFDDLKKTMGDIAAYNKSQADALAAESKKMAVVINTLVYSGMFGGTLLAILIGIFLTRAISRPIVKLEGVAKKIADGDISFEIKADSNDEIGSLTRSFAAMSDNLNNILGQIQSAVEQVAAGSKQVSDSSQALSQSATEQASSLEEITASMTELSSQTKQNAENATQANQLASVARGSAEGGNTHMLEMVKAMGEIDLSSQNISKIIKVIDEIAFQTNLLALNAAVEAARAGVHGKGFAVVAQEVRNLAARSAKAAKETADMIEGSIKRVNLGSEIANKTASSLTEIVAGVGKVTSLVAEIAAASNEQAQGINQVNAGLGQLDQVTQQNTASAEESASASEELSGQAVEVRQLLSRFTLRGSDSVKANGKNGSAPHQLIRHVVHAEVKNEHVGTNGNGNGNGHRVLAAVGANGNKSAVKPVISLDDKEYGKY